MMNNKNLLLSRENFAKLNDDHSISSQENARHFCTGIDFIFISLNFIMQYLDII